MRDWVVRINANDGKEAESRIEVAGSGGGQDTDEKVRRFIQSVGIAARKALAAMDLQPHESDVREFHNALFPAKSLLPVLDVPRESTLDKPPRKKAEAERVYHENGGEQ